MTTVVPSNAVGPRVRQAEPADLSAVYRIERSAFPQPWPLGAFEQFVGQSGFLVAEDAGVVGYVVADVAANNGRALGHVKDLAVSSGRRREGIGSLLLANALQVLDGRADTVKLEVRESNERALSLYRDYGFEYHQTVPDYYSNGESALVLVRPLEACGSGTLP